MPNDWNNLQLLRGVYDGNFDAVKAALGDGADLNGSPEQPLPPIVAATILEHFEMVVFLLGEGADPDIPVNIPPPCPDSEMTEHVNTIPGERALHIAARTGNINLAMLLLKQACAEPDATDSRGCTPLMATLECGHPCVEVVRMLLDFGADPTLENEHGCTPLHTVTLNGNTELVDMLYAKAPATLNQYSNTGQTPLFLACSGGREAVVSRLLSLGAKQQMPWQDECMCPLLRAVFQGYIGVVRILMHRRGIRAIGGEVMLLHGMNGCVLFRRPRILRLLLTMDGQEGRSKWANADYRGRRLLHHGAGFCNPDAVSVLLEAGADEAARDSQGYIPLDLIGLLIAVVRDDGGVRRDRWKKVAIGRMLQRGPAYRARSWAWPSDEEETAAGGSTDGDTAAAADGAAVLSSPPAGKIRVRIFRPKEENSRKLFVRLVGRYCAKD